MDPQNFQNDRQGPSFKSLFQVVKHDPLSPIQITQVVAKLVFFAIFILLIAPTILVLAYVALFKQPIDLLSVHCLLFLEIGSFLFVCALSALLALSERREFGDYGLPLRDAFRGKFWLGFLLGLAEISVLTGLISLCGGYSFGSFSLHGSEIAHWGLLHLALFLFVGLYEEFFFRGYLQFTAAAIFGFWPTAVFLSVGFGLIHLTNRGENWVGALSVALIGLLFAFTLRRTGNLWYAVGLHAGFDWGESFLYSLPDSGSILEGHLSNAVLQGSRWLTGGTVGPEGSVFCFLTVGLQFLIAMWLFPKRSTATDSTAPPTHL